MVSAFLLTSCVPSIPPEEYDALRDALEEAQRKTGELMEDISSIQSEHDKLQDSYNEIQDTHESLQADYEKLQSLYKNLQAGLEKSALENPAWPDLKAFLEQDETDTMAYVENSFDCSGFAIALRDHAALYGMKSAYVEIGFSAGAGHALNAFETSDEGLIYIDNTNADQVAYVKLGQRYGTIPLNGVKSEHIDCSGNPGEFWGSLSYATFDDLFSYNYYLGYQQRRTFYEESVEEYNSAVKAYNRGSGMVSASQFEAWLKNIEALEQDLGSPYFVPMETIISIEWYWN